LRRRSNPWPALVDLFGALLIVTFGGLMLSYGNERQEGEDERKVRQAMQDIATAVSTKAGPTGIKASVREDCDPEDKCIDLNIQFPVNSAVISSEVTRAEICNVAETLANGLKALEDQRKIEVVVEGHTDKTNLIPDSAPRLRFEKNWRLSSDRASAVLFEMRECGLDTETFSLLTMGYADTKPVCGEDTPECLQKNRRTTLRLRARASRRHTTTTGAIGRPPPGTIVDAQMISSRARASGRALVR
jgi:flagellar motor protein MotB